MQPGTLVQTETTQHCDPGPARTSLLSTSVILDLLDRGIVIHPFNREQLKSASYDVRIGPHYFRRKQSVETGDLIFNPYSPEVVKRHFGEPQVAKPAREHKYWKEDHPSWDGIKPHDHIIMLEPGELILAHTQEFIGGTKDPETGRCFVAMMKARSSIGRIGIEACRCAGWGDVGYINRWTMEVKNDDVQPIPVIVGTRIAQMVFFEVPPIENQDLYGADRLRDHYQASAVLHQLMSEWKPEMMLPRLVRDEGYTQ